MHSITFGDKNTWEDWGLLPSSRPVFNPAIPEMNSDDTNIGNGIIWGNDQITPIQTLGDREGEIEFYVANQNRSWIGIYTEVLNYLHGKKMTAVLEDDPLYFYQGRFFVKKYNPKKDFSLITISYKLDAYKYLISDPTVKEL